MIELAHDSLVFSFPDVHPEASLTITFQRTLRIPDNNKTYPLPPGLGAFPLRHLDDYAQRAPAAWLERGGVLMPMYQAEAMWLNFSCAYLREHEASYPFAVKVATGKIDAVSGKAWSNELHREPQDYMVAPNQPWLDGYCVAKGAIRQFVAMPLGEGFTAEEQLTGTAEHGGLQILVYPMVRTAFERRFPKQTMRERVFRSLGEACMASPCDAEEMGLAPGGKMKQEIYRDPYDMDEWELDQRSRCFVHILNSHRWRVFTGEKPPHQPPTAKQYTAAGLPWFDYYDADAKPLEGAAKLAGLKSVQEKISEKEKERAGTEAAIDPEQIIQLRAKLKKGQVREGSF
jgi:hypothetical protein